MARSRSLVQHPPVLVVVASIWLPLAAGALGGTAAAVLNRAADAVLALRSERRSLRSAAQLYADELARCEQVLEAVRDYQQWLGDDWPDGWDEYRREFASAGVRGDDWERLNAAHHASLQARAAREYAIDQARKSGGTQYILAGRDYAGISIWENRIHEAQEVLERLMR
jgi:hypothetical protein